MRAERHQAFGFLLDFALGRRWSTSGVKFAGFFFASRNMLSSLSRTARPFFREAVAKKISAARGAAGVGDACIFCATAQHFVVLYLRWCSSRQEPPYLSECLQPCALCQEEDICKHDQHVFLECAPRRPCRRPKPRTNTSESKSL